MQGSRLEADDLRPLYERWVRKAYLGLTADDDDDWLHGLTQRSARVPAAVLATHALLPEAQGGARPRIRRLYRPFEIPALLPDVARRVATGNSEYVECLEQFQRAFKLVSEAAWERRGFTERNGQFVLLTMPHHLRRWVRPDGESPDLRSIVGHRTRVRRAVDRFTWRSDWQSQNGVLAFVRDVVASAPHLVDRSDDLAAEGARLLISGMADVVPIQWTPSEALQACGGPTDNVFPVDLDSESGWQTLRMWKYRPSAMVTDLASDGDMAGARAVLDAGAEAVLPGISYAVGRQRRGRPVPRSSQVPALGARGAPESPSTARPLASINRGAADRRNRSHVTSGKKTTATLTTSSTTAWGTRKKAPRQTKAASRAALAAIDALVGLDALKMQLRQITAVAEVDRRRRDEGMPQVPMGFHMVLAGNPGTGKTTVARLVGQLFSEMGVLSRGHLVEAAPADFIAKYVGQTEAKTRALIERAAGGLLFIDEAYNLAPTHERDFGHEAIAVLVAEMENRRDDLVVLAAGYGQEMHEFLDSNPGLRSRFSYTLDFPDLDDDALLSVLSPSPDAMASSSTPQLREPWFAR